MAVIINGSGTVTGLAVGGLPDGSVDADTLAANSVTAAKIVDGTIVDAEVTSLAASKLTGALPAISAANLTGIPAGNLTGTVADARISALTASKLTGALPAIDGSALTGAGKLLQQVEAVVGVTGNLTGLTTATEISTGLRLNITVQKSTSKLRIWFNPSSEVDNDIGMDTTCYARIYNGATLVATTIDNQMSWRDNDTNSGTIVFNSLAHGTSAGTVIQVRVYIVSGSASGNMDFGQFGSTMTRVEEIG